MEAKQRPGVLEAKACMHHINITLKDYPEYLIRSCTNTGIWIVEKTDVQTGSMIARYDFVNREYSGADTGGSPIDIDSLGGTQESDFLDLQKSLNRALLE